MVIRWELAESACQSYLSLMKLIGATSSILFCNFKKCIPFSVVLKECVTREERTMDISKNDTAVVFIDAQNEVLSEKGLA